MLSAFGAGPSAELMDSTRALTLDGGLAPPGRPKEEAVGVWGGSYRRAGGMDAGTNRFWRT